MNYSLNYLKLVLLLKLLCWHRKFIDIFLVRIYALFRIDKKRLRQRTSRQRTKRKTMNFSEKKNNSSSIKAIYQFRPFEVKRIDYKNYSLAVQGRGINFYPKPRSGHRIVANDSDLYCFGGKILRKQNLNCVFVND